MHDIIGFGLVLLAILAGMFFNNKGVSDLKTDMHIRFGEVNGRLDRMQADLSQFYRTIGQHEAKIENLEARKA